MQHSIKGVSVYLFLFVRGKTRKDILTNKCSYLYNSVTADKERITAGIFDEFCLHAVGQEDRYDGNDGK